MQDRPENYVDDDGNQCHEEELTTKPTPEDLVDAAEECRRAVAVLERKDRDCASQELLPSTSR